MMRPHLSIVIPVHNRIKLTRKCLASLSRQTRSDFTTIVIDDGSTDGTSEMIKAEYPAVTLLQGDGDLWWTRATNMGIEFALSQGARYIITLNDDVLATTDFIDKMIFWSERKPRALLGAVALDVNTLRPIYGGERIDWRMASYTSLLEILRSEEQQGLHEVTHLPGRGLLVPSEVFDKIGLFDAHHFPQSAADHDFTHRAIRAGFSAFCNYDAKVLIYPDSMTGRYSRRNKSVKNYLNHLFGVKGGGNLRYFFFYAIRNCPRSTLPLFLSIGIMKRIFGYPRDWIFELLSFRDTSHNIQR